MRVPDISQTPSNHGGSGAAGCATDKPKDQDRANILRASVSSAKGVLNEESASYSATGRNVNQKMTAETMYTGFLPNSSEKLAKNKGAVKIL